MTRWAWAWAWVCLLPLACAAQDASLGSLLAQGRFDALEQRYRDDVTSRRRDPQGATAAELFFRELAGEGSGQVGRPDTAEAAARWVAASPRSLAAAIFRAGLLLDRAEAIADAQGDWKETDRLAAEASRLLESVRAEGVADSNWHAARVRMGALVGWPVEQVLAETTAAVLAEPHAIEPFFAAFHHLPRTFDPAIEAGVRALAHLAAEKTRDTDGQAMYARVYLIAGGVWDELVQHPFAPGRMDWDRMDQAMRDLHSRWPDPAARDLNMHAILACRAGDKAQTAALLGQLQDRLQPASWERAGGRALYPRCREWAVESGLALGSHGQLPL